MCDTGNSSSTGNKIKDNCRSKLSREECIIIG